MILLRQLGSRGKNYVSPIREKLQKSLNTFAFGAIIDVVEGQGIVETSVQALESFFVCAPRWRYDFTQAVGLTW